MAAFALLCGAAFYAAFRPAGSAQFVPELVTNWLLVTGSALPIGRPADSIPSFVHVFSFGIASAVVLTPRLLHAYLSCGFWLLANGLSEVCQAQTFKARLLEQVAVSAATPLMHLQSFCYRGVFDPFDIAGAVLGAAAAILWLRRFWLKPTKIKHK